MRYCAALFVGLISVQAFAVEYPVLSNPEAQGLLNRYMQEKPVIDSPTFFNAPETQPTWACQIDGSDLYIAAGIPQADPTTRAKTEKMTSKQMRELGMSPNIGALPVYTNITITPIKSQCADGKLDGDIQVLTSYDSRSEFKNTSQISGKVITGNTVTSIHALLRTHRSYNHGVPVGASVLVQQMDITSETHYDDAQLEENSQKMAKISGMGKPAKTRIVSYRTESGLSISFAEMEEKKVSAGLLGPNITNTIALTTNVTTPVDEHRTRIETYKNSRLISAGGMKDFKPHGDQVTYMDNYLKKLNMRLDQVPGMEDARIVTVDGAEMIENHRCMQNGLPLKASPCPEE